MSTNQQKGKTKAKAFGISVVIYAFIFGVLWFNTVWSKPPDTKQNNAKGKRVLVGISKKKISKKNHQTPKAVTPKVRKVVEKQAVPKKTKPQPIKKVIEPAPATKSVSKKNIITNQKSKKSLVKKQRSKVKKAEAKTQKKVETPTLKPEKKVVTSTSTSKPSDTEASSNNKAKKLEGQQKGNSTQLAINNWHWIREPIVNDPTQETGKVVIEFTINEYGNVIDTNVIGRTISQTVAKHYIQSIEDTPFQPTIRPAKGATKKGTVTFNIAYR